MKRHGTWGGAVAGAMVGILFPPAIIATAAVGGAAGAIGGHLWRGLSRSDVKELGELIDAGEAALLLIGGNTLEAAIGKLQLKADRARRQTTRRQHQGHRRRHQRRRARDQRTGSARGRRVMNTSTSKGGAALVALATAQFLMVLDQSVMNVSISQLVKDFDTTVTTIQAVITLYCLVMAMLILTGAKIGDIIGRRRAFVIGLIIYACGSALTAASQTVAVLALGWSVLEGIGAGLVFPALAALIAGNFEGTRRKAAYAVIGGVAGAGIAVGPIVGGWATTELTWRVVFVGEVFIAGFILFMTRKVKDAPGPTPTPKLDVVGSVLSAAGLGLFVFGVLESSTWGWLKPKNSPITIFGFSLTLFVIAAGCVAALGIREVAAATARRRTATHSSTSRWPTSQRCGPESSGSSART